MFVEKTKNLLTFAEGPKETAKEKKKGGGGGGRVSVGTGSKPINRLLRTISHLSVFALVRLIFWVCELLAFALWFRFFSHKEKSKCSTMRHSVRTFSLLIGQMCLLYITKVNTGRRSCVSVYVNMGRSSVCWLLLHHLHNDLARCRCQFLQFHFCP